MRAGRLAAVLTLLLLPFAGCGKKGPPVAPEPRGPFTPQVGVRQIGGRVLVSFDVPPPKGGQPAQRVALAELERVEYAPTVGAPPPDALAFRLRGAKVAELDLKPREPASRATLEDPALGTLADSGAGWTLRYLVRLRDQRGRASRGVITPDLVLARPPAPPALRSAEPTSDGIRLVWEPGPLPAETGTAEPDAPEEPEAASAEAREPGETVRRFNLYRWRPEESVPERPLNELPIVSPEYLDGSVETGGHYAYAVREVVGGEGPLRESESSAPIEVEAADRFAPAAPTGLVAVQEGRTVRLFWNPGNERDLAGYRVYRRRGAGDWERVGPERLEQPTYVDADARVGDRLTYRVTAIDRAPLPNESEASAAREVDVAAEPADELPR